MHGVVRDRVRTHAIAQPGAPAIDVHLDVDVAQSLAEPGEITVAVCVVKSTERQRIIGDAVEQIPRALAVRTELDEHMLDGTRRSGAHGFPLGACCCF